MTSSKKPAKRASSGKSSTRTGAKKSMGPVEGLLRLGLERIRAGWTQGNYNRIKGGVESFCMLGAVRNLNEFEQQPAYDGAKVYLFEALPYKRAKEDPWLSITSYNDSKRRKRGDVIAVYQKAIKAAHRDHA